MSKSVIQDTKECYLCRLKARKIGYTGELSPYGLHRHHMVFGTANRKKAEKYGLWVYVCSEKHHEHGPESPHENREVREMLCRVAQRAFEREHTREEWRREFGKSWL